MASEVNRALFCSCHTYTIQLAKPARAFDGIDQVGWYLSSNRTLSEDQRDASSTFVNIQQGSPINRFWKITPSQTAPGADPNTNVFNIALDKDRSRESNVDQSGWELASLRSYKGRKREEEIPGPIRIPIRISVPDPARDDVRGETTTKVHIGGRRAFSGNRSWEIKFDEANKAFTIQLACDNMSGVDKISQKDWFLSARRQQEPFDMRDSKSTYVITHKNTDTRYWQITPIEDPLTKDLKIQIQSLQKELEKIKAVLEIKDEESS